MHLVVDAVVVRTGSVTIVMEHLIGAWAKRFPDDRITVLFGPDGQNFALPTSARAERLAPAGGPLSGAWLRSVSIRQAARRLGADAVLSSVPASGLIGTRVPRGVILYDLRFELRPQQFSRKTRIARKISWLWSLRLADAIFTISDRTLEDLRRLHPSLAGKARTAALGSEHALAWPVPEPSGQPYAIAFGHFGNKNADAVIAGWAEFSSEHPEWVLQLVGMGAADRAAAEEEVSRLGIADRVRLMPWLDDDQFAQAFAGASMVLFPSDFEGFGLPAAEAIRLGIPAVVSTDPALAEVTGGHAITAHTTQPHDLADAFRQALALSDTQLCAGRTFAESFTWTHTAEVVRSGLESHPSSPSHH